MKNHFFTGMLLAGILAAPIAAQMPDGYLDMYIAKVKMGKRAEFDAINKRMAEINRKNKGDTWLAYEALYGEPNAVTFVSTRTSYGAAEEGIKALEGSATRALGAAGMHRLFNDFEGTLDSARSELRRRRWDLSASAPADAASYNQLVGQSRYLRTVIVRVRSGKTLDFESQLQLNKSAQERANSGVPFLVSQNVAGELGVYYISSLVKSLADLDKIKPLQEVLGSSYAMYEKVAAESIASTEIIIGRFLPELSNPPAEVVAVDPKFWRPAPPPAPKPAEGTK